MSEPRERDREQRFAAAQRALDESDRNERMEDDRGIEIMAQKWERVVQRHASSEES